MLKNKKILVLCLSSLLGVSCLVGCGNNNSTGNNSENSSPKTSETNSEYNVSFYVDSVLYGTVQKVAKGGKVTKPADPTREADEDNSYTFNGWYENGSSVAWNFDTDTVNKNLDLFAEFDAIPNTYDLIVWVYGINGATEPETYITLDESNRMRDAFLETVEDKKVSWQYYEYLTNDAFNAKVLSKKVKPDVIVSGAKMTGGNNPLTMKEEYGRTKVGQGWFNNTSRYVGILNDCDANLELAIDLYEMISSNGPDYFTLDYEAATLVKGETKAISATLSEGDTRAVTYTSLDTSVATVEDGVITAVEEGTTIITATLGYVTINIEITVIANLDYQLVVWVYGVNGASSPTTYITLEESEFMKNEFMSLDIAKDKEILWNYSAGLVNADFNAAVNNANPTVDVVISGNNLDKAEDNPVALHSQYGKVKVGDGWFENTGRRVAVTAACSDNLELAVALYELVTNVGPDHEFEMSKSELSLIVGGTYQLEAPVYKKTVTWSSSNEEVATVEDGLVTAVGAGNATITAKDSDNNEVTCEVVVTAPDTSEEGYDLVVYTYLAASKSTYITVDEYEIIKTEFTKEGAAGYEKDILWIEFSGGNQEALGEFIASAAAGEYPDVIIARSGISTGKVGDLIIDNTTYTNINTSWTANDSNYVAITGNANPNNIELGKSLITMLGTAKA